MSGKNRDVGQGTVSDRSDDWEGGESELGVVLVDILMTGGARGHACIVDGVLARASSGTQVIQIKKEHMGWSGTVEAT